MTRGSDKINNHMAQFPTTRSILQLQKQFKGFHILVLIHRNNFEKEITFISLSCRKQCHNTDNIDKPEII